MRSLRLLDRPALFLSTLSLRRATQRRKAYKRRSPYFYPRSPCGERHYQTALRSCTAGISIHALLAESDIARARRASIDRISIHALLAESDSKKVELNRTTGNFYPRSPCGERLKIGITAVDGIIISIHALLAESDPLDEFQDLAPDISIHALLAESDLRLMFWPFRPC